MNTITSHTSLLSNEQIELILYKLSIEIKPFSDLSKNIKTYA